MAPIAVPSPAEIRAVAATMAISPPRPGRFGGGGRWAAEIGRAVDGLHVVFPSLKLLLPFKAAYWRAPTKSRAEHPPLPRQTTKIT